MTRRYALVTGASSGIGAALAGRLAARGTDLLLVARRAERLERQAEDFRRLGVAVDIRIADLSIPSGAQDLLDGVAAAGRPIDILVNGAGYFQPAPFRDWSLADQQRFLQLMLHSVCELTHGLAPGMAARGQGGILTVASLQGLIPGVPGHALYGAVKAFLIRFSEALHLELRDAGVKVSVLCPGLTRTAFFEANQTRDRYFARTPDWAWQEADAVARAGIAALESNVAKCVPGAFNLLVAVLAKHLPDKALRALVASQAWRFR